MGLSFNKLPTGDHNLDRVQENIAELARQIPAASSPVVVTVTSDYRVTGTEDILHVDAQRAPVRITLPAPSTSLKPLTVKQVNLGGPKSQVNSVTVATADGSKTIAGQAYVSLDNTGTGSITLTCDGRQFWPSAGAPVAPGSSSKPAPIPLPVPTPGTLSTALPLAGGGSMAKDLTLKLIYEEPLVDDAGTLTVKTFGPSGPDHSTGAVPDPGDTAGSTKYLCEDAAWSIPARVGATSSDPSPDYLASKIVSPNSTIAVASAGGGSLVGIDIAGTPSATLVYTYNLAGFNGLAMTNVGVFAGATEAYNTGQGPLRMSTSGASSADCEYGLNVIATKVTIRARIVRNDLSGGTGTMAFHVTRGGSIEATLFVTEGAGAQDLDATATVTGSVESDTWGLSFTNGTGATGGAFTGTITVSVSAG